MKILYAIQGTGNGHVSRAKEIIPVLEKYGELDILVSGTQADITLPHPLKYRFHGFSYVFGKRGGIDFLKTFKQINLYRFWKDMMSIPLEEYDLIINDFEPITAWACKIKKKKCIALSHQASFISAKTPRPNRKGLLAEQILRYYAPATAYIGFHFKTYDDFIYPPVIRSEIRNLKPQNHGHYTVYLPAVDDKLLIKHLHKLPDIQWHVFSKHQKTPYRFGNVSVKPVINEDYNKSLENCEGLLTGGGFEGPAEALYLGKKVMLIPMKGQFEQICNAEAARQLGVPVVYAIKANFAEALKKWIADDSLVKIEFPDSTSHIIDKIMQTSTLATAR